MRLISQKCKMTMFIRYFGFTKVPMIFYCRPKVLSISEESVTVRIRLRRKTKNQLVQCAKLGGF